MSLLLDALKRAEQEKLARSPGDPAPMLVETGRPPSTPAANGMELQPLTAGPGTAPPPPGVIARNEANAHAAQAVFQAKTAGNAPAAGKSRGMVWATIGAVAVVAIAAGAYVWYSVKSLTPQTATFTPRPRPAPLPPIQSSPPPLDTPVIGQAPTMGEPPSVPLAPPVASVASAAPPPSRVAVPMPPETGVDPSPRRADAVARVLREAPAATPPPVHLDRSAATPRGIPAGVSAGYDALRRGDFGAARSSYTGAIANDPTNVDAHLGLATVNARTGNRSGAAVEYRRVLDLDPRNSTALAALAALAEFSRPEALEMQLRSDLTRFPESSALHFTLGNVMAAQGRWKEAQPEYYEAHRLDPGSGDVMYNLAVSLDHLGQTRVAADFYARALDASKVQPAQFDVNAATHRLAKIR